MSNIGSQEKLLLNYWLMNESITCILSQCISPTEWSSGVPSFCSDNPSESSAPASAPAPEPPWHVLNDNQNCIKTSISPFYTWHTWPPLVFHTFTLWKMWSQTTERGKPQLWHEAQTGGWRPLNSVYQGWASCRSALHTTSEKSQKLRNEREHICDIAF